MDHSWGPPPIQGNNICPTCSISHFPFCPPPPHPSRFPPPNFDSNRPVYDPGYWNRNPSLPQMGGPYSMQHSGGYGDGGYMGSEYNNNNVDDRCSKRLRVDGMYPGSYGGSEGTINSSNISSEDNERRLKLIRDHGGPNFDFGYAQESSGFDRSFDAREPGNLSNVGMRPSSNDIGYGTHYQRDDLEYQSGYRSASNIDRYKIHDHQPPQHGQVANAAYPRAFHHGGVGYDEDSQSHEYHHSNYGGSHASTDRFYGNNLGHMPSNDAPLQYEQRSNMLTSSQYSTSQSPLPNTMQQPGQMRYDYRSPSHFSDVRQPLEARSRPVEGYQAPFGNQNVPLRPRYGLSHMDNQGGYGSPLSENVGHLRAPHGFEVRPPLPASPPPPLPREPPGHLPTNLRPVSSPPRMSSSLFPIPVSSSAALHSSYAPIPESQVRGHPHLQNPQIVHAPRSVFQGNSQATLTSSGHYLGEGQPFPPKSNIPNRAKIIDASHLFKPPYRATRPDYFVVILRGLPGSGKSYLAKMLRDLEVEHGGNAPRIHSMDDYFMTEVEKAEDNEASKSSVRGKKATMKMVLEYCYEPEMEEAYRSSMLKAFKKTLEEGAFTFVIVDDRNLRVADFAQFWATAKRSGYEVYVLDAPYKDPAGCAARNVHGFTQEDVEKMAAQWEEAPPLYLQLNVKSLFHGDDLKENNIEEVDMETEDGNFDGDLSKLEESEPGKIVSNSAGDLGTGGSSKDEKSLDAEGDNPIEEVRDLGRSKWLGNMDDDDEERTDLLKGKSNVLSGLLKTYGKEGKSVQWGDQGGRTGFSIGAVKKANAASLVIGPGAGYNLKSNPLPEEDVPGGGGGKSGETKKHKVFEERLRAERESFRAVFDRRRRQRIGGLVAEDE